MKHQKVQLRRLGRPGAVCQFLDFPLPRLSGKDLSVPRDVSPTQCRFVRVFRPVPGCRPRFLTLSFHVPDLAQDRCYSD